MKRKILAILLISILILSGCKAERETTTAMAAGYVDVQEEITQDVVLPNDREESELESELKEPEQKEPVKAEPEQKEPEKPQESAKEEAEPQPKPDASTQKEDAAQPPKADQTPRKLTIEDVISLSEKGEALSYKDFENYICEVESEENNRREYRIDDRYTVRVSFSEEKTNYIFLIAYDTGSKGVLDIRKGGVAEFVEERKQYQPLTTVAYEPIVYKIKCASFDSFYQHAKQYGTVEYYQHVEAIERGYIRIDTMEEYLLYTGGNKSLTYDVNGYKENVLKTYNEAFFEKNSLFLFDVSYGSGGYRALDLRVGKQGDTLYVNITTGCAGGFGYTADKKSEFYHLEIPKDQLVGVTKNVQHEQFVSYFVDPEEPDEDWTEPEPEYPPPPDYSAELPQE